MTDDNATPDIDTDDGFALGLTGELIEFKTPLLRWEGPEDGTYTYINPQLVTFVQAKEGELAVALADGNMSSTTDIDTIVRFWEQYEIV